MTMKRKFSPHTQCFLNSHFIHQVNLIDLGQPKKFVAIHYFRICFWINELKLHLSMLLFDFMSFWNLIILVLIGSKVLCFDIYLISIIFISFDFIFFFLFSSSCFIFMFISSIHVVGCSVCEIIDANFLHSIITNDKWKYKHMPLDVVGVCNTLFWYGQKHYNDDIEIGPVIIQWKYNQCMCLCLSAWLRPHLIRLFHPIETDKSVCTHTPTQT